MIVSGASEFSSQRGQEKENGLSAGLPQPFDLARVACSTLCSVGQTFLSAFSPRQTRMSAPPGASALMFTPLHIARVHCLPLGASSTPEGVNFALLCRHGTAV